jgi:hypothetical protein
MTTWVNLANRIFPTSDKADEIIDTIKVEAEEDTP